jgi:hypothetical protein
VNWVPTREEVDRAGDCLLEALVATAWDGPHPEPGDLVVETSSVHLDWERVGYLLEPLPDDPDAPIVVWSIGRRVVRWHNASVCRVGPAGMRLRSLPFPSLAEIKARA